MEPIDSETLDRSEPGITFNSHGSHRDCIGFGFDPLNNDYKIVRVVYLFKKAGCIVPPEVEVYEL